MCFQIKFCENQAWGAGECRTRRTSPEKLIKTADDGVGTHEAFSYELQGDAAFVKPSSLL